MSLGEKIAAAIIDAEMRLAGYVRLDENTSMRIAAYLEESELRERFLADAQQIAGDPPETLTEAFLSLIPVEYEVNTCLDGITAKRCDWGWFQLQ